MFIKTNEDIAVIDGSIKNGIKLVVLKAGQHEVEVIKSPLDGICEWVVLMGTMIGASKSLWGRLHSNGRMEFVYPV